ncbi:MAG: ankyrin repeat domain-containing protein, partial [Bacteroidota bacterium]
DTKAQGKKAEKCRALQALSAKSTRLTKDWEALCARFAQSSPYLPNAPEALKSTETRVQHLLLELKEQEHSSSTHQLLLSKTQYPTTIPTALFQAIQQKDFALARTLIRTPHWNTEARDEEDYTAAMRAAAGGHEDLVKLLYEAGADMNAYKMRDDLGVYFKKAKENGGEHFFKETVFKLAIRSNSLSLVQFLLTHGVSSRIYWRVLERPTHLSPAMHTYLDQHACEEHDNIECKTS